MSWALNLPLTIHIIIEFIEIQNVSAVGFRGQKLTWKTMSPLVHILTLLEKQFSVFFLVMHGCVKRVA